MIPHIAITNGIKIVSLFNLFAMNPTTKAVIAMIVKIGPNTGNSFSPTHYVFARLGLFPRTWHSITQPPSSSKYGGIHSKQDGSSEIPHLRQFSPQSTHSRLLISGAVESGHSS